jgi:deazaflavin-dependent oxidoreductase (nitroreductase family)
MDFNDQMVAAFRANGGNVTAPADFGRSLILVHVPRKDGSIKVRPLRAVPDGESWTVVGSAAGAPHDPAWVHGLRRSARAGEPVDIEVPAEPGPEKVATRVEELTGAERDRIWGLFLEAAPAFAEYEAKAEGRVFPVFRFTRA